MHDDAASEAILSGLAVCSGNGSSQVGSGPSDCAGSHAPGATKSGVITVLELESCRARKAPKWVRRLGEDLHSMNDSPAVFSRLFRADLRIMWSYRD